VAATEKLGDDRFEAEVLGLDEAGAGVAETAAGDEVLRVHAAGALPGERIRGYIVYRSAHLSAGQRSAWAELEAVITPSTDRVAAPCPAHGRCGGCALMPLAYPAQIAWKRERVRDQLHRHVELAGVEVAPCVPSPVTVGYRNQAKWVCGRGEGGEVVLGAYAPRSHDIVDLGGCQVVEPILDQGQRILLGILRSQGVQPYHEVRRTGVLRYAMLRANAAGEVLATLVAYRDWEQADAVAAAFMAELPALVGVVLNLNSTTGNALFGDTERLLAGRSAIDDQMGDVRVRLGSRSFFQANRAVGSRIYRDLVARLPGHFGRAVDVYSGAGGIALSLAARAREVVAIEVSPAATDAAASGPSESATHRLRVVTADAALGLATVDAADLVVLNPPRKGCSDAVLAQVRRLSPEWIVYLSCEPRTLARDLAILSSGASITSVVPYDMMPHTPHVETLAILSRRRVPQDGESAHSESALPR
jgi:23S rRNA (uracil1939-C5)-methyltransferase